MNRHVSVLALLIFLSHFALAQQASRNSQSTISESTVSVPPLMLLAALQEQAAPQAPPNSVASDDHKHLSRKEKKELKKARDQQRKDEKRLLKKEAEERKREDKQRQKQIAKEGKKDRKQHEKEIANERHEEHRREQKEQTQVSRDMRKDAPRPSMVGRTTSVAAAPYRMARFATPRLLRAQRDVGRAIYTQLPASNVAVLLTHAGQIVLRGAAPTAPLHSQLLQLAMGAAGGYPIVDELAASFVGDAASAATSAAIGGVSDLIHGRSNDNGSEPGNSSSDLPPEASRPAQNSASAYDSSARAIPLDHGSSACANLSNTQVLLTGQATSQASADLIRQFARTIASPKANLDDQLIVKTNGMVVAAPPQATTSPTGPENNTRPAAPVTAGSTVCLNASNTGELLLTGTVASPSEVSAVEQAAQPLVAGGRLADQLTIGSLPSTSQVATGGTTGLATESTSAADASTPSSTAIASGPVPSTPAPSGNTAEENDVEQALHSIPRLANVDVEVRADAVRLSGTVDTVQDEQMATAIARQHVPGMSVIDNLTVAVRTPQS